MINEDKYTEYCIKTFFNNKVDQHLMKYLTRVSYSVIHSRPVCDTTVGILAAFTNEENFEKFIKHLRYNDPLEDLNEYILLELQREQRLSRKNRNQFKISRDIYWNKMSSNR